MKKKTRLRKGMTLIELIIAMAILSIIVIAFLNMFTVGFTGIINASKHTEVGYEAQKDMENSILTDPSTGIISIEIEFSGGTTIESIGKVLEEEVNNGNQNINVKTFVPNP